jgi:hypothetical protein
VSRKLSKGDPLPSRNRYRDLVEGGAGELYLANTVRPDLSYAAGLLGRFSSAPTTHHRRAGLHVLKYFKGTVGLGLVREKGSSGIVA